MAFINVLPDPINSIGYAGRTGALYGQGFSSISLRSTKKESISRALSNNSYISYKDGHLWELSLSYNPMTKTDFNIVGSFVKSRIGSKKPFYVQLPQYIAPQDATLNSNTNPLAISSSFSSDGVTTVTEYSSNYIVVDNVSRVGLPTIGDLLNVVDYSTTNHTKVYKVAKVATSTSSFVATSNTTSDLLSYTNHGLVTGQLVWTSAAGGLSASTNYYVIRINDHRFALSSTIGGTTWFNLTADTNVTIYVEPKLTATQVKIYLGTPLVRPVNISGTNSISAVSTAASDIFTLIGHGLSDGDVLLSTNAAVGGIVNNTIYYVISATADTFQVSTTSGGSAVNLTTAATNTFTCRPTTVNFHNVKMYCTATNLTEYSIDQDYLYKFNLELTEFQA